MLSLRYVQTIQVEMSQFGSGSGLRMLRVLSIEVMNEITKGVSIKRKEESSVFVLLFLSLLYLLSCSVLSLFLYIEKFPNIC